MNGTFRRNRLTGLTAVLAVLYLWVGVAGHGLDRVLGLTGSLLILAALVVARTSRPAAQVLLLAGGATTCRCGVVEHRGARGGVAGGAAGVARGAGRRCQAKSQGLRERRWQGSTGPGPARAW